MLCHREAAGVALSKTTVFGFVRVLVLPRSATSPTHICKP